MKLFLALIFQITCVAGSAQSNMSDDSVLISEINKNRPLNGATIATGINHKLGATHVAGKYFFSNEPYLVEGSRKLNELGYGVIKLWFRKNGGGYPFNSEWNLKKGVTLKEVAEHPYWVKAFQLPFSTFALSIDGAGVRTTDSSARKEEEELYELAVYLLRKYRDREVTFIFHNWEGDWVMRGGTGDAARWSRKSGELIRAIDGDRYTVPVPADSMERISAMAKWFSARQKAVDRARLAVPDAKSKIYHAVEANKVLDSRAGIPGIINSVLPLIETDMVSWSCYDGLDSSGVDLYRGIEFIKSKIRPTSYMKNKKIVFLGEIGIPEQRYEGLMTRKAVVDRWDAYMSVCKILDIPYLIQWELYCNEPKDEALRQVNEVRKTDEMRGFWLIRPDGSWSYAQEFFDLLLRYSGKQIPAKEIKSLN